MAAHFVERLAADAARRRVHRALEGGVVGAVGEQAQVGQRVLDFHALEEALAAVHAVRQAGLHQLFFDRARLGVGAVQHGVVAGAAAVADPGLHAVDDEAGFVHFVVGGEQVDRLALAVGGPQLLAEAVGVVGDHRVGGGQDVAGGAVVLLELERARARVVLQEALHVLHLGAAPAVDGLVVVAHHEHFAGVAGQHAHEGVLDGVGVLELVHQQVPEALLVVVQQHRVLEPQLVRAQQQFGEIHQARALAALLVGLVDLEHGGAEEVAAARLDVLRAPALVLLRVDPPGHLARREAAFVEFEVGADALEQAHLVVLVEHLEGLGQAGLLPVQAQQAVRQAVEGADPHAARAVAQQRLDAAAHLGGGLVGEGDGQDAVRRHAHHFVQPADAVGEHAGLARAGARQHQGMARRRGNHFALGRVEFV